MRHRREHHDARDVIIDGTLVDAMLHARSPVSQRVLEHLVASVRALMESGPPPFSVAWPLMHPGSPLAELFDDPPPHVILEPLDAGAHEAARLILLDRAEGRIGGQATSASDEAHDRQQHIIVHPRGRTLGDANAGPPDAMPDGDLGASGPAPYTREQVVWLLGPGTDENPHTRTYNANGRTQTSREPRWLAALERFLAHRDDHADSVTPTRLRLSDPMGHITPELVPRFLDLIDQVPTTIVVENARGLALATARAIVKSAKSGSDQAITVRTSLLGIGPRTGHAPTELLLAPDDTKIVHGVALRASAAAGWPIEATHPLWGTRRTEAVEPELAGREGPDGITYEPALGPGNIETYLRDRLRRWNIPCTADEADVIVNHLRSSLRAGEQPDDATMYAVAATHLDLAALAARSPEEPLPGDPHRNAAGSTPVAGRARTKGAPDDD